MTVAFQTLVETSRKDIDFELVEGHWPDDMGGEIFISAPETMNKTPSVLFGPGYLIRLSLKPGLYQAKPNQFAWRARCIHTPSTRIYKENPDLYEGTVVGLVSIFGNVNAVNTAPLVCGERLFVTWDAGRPAEVDASRLSFMGMVGSKASWGGGSTPSEVLFPTIFSSAHPVYDEERQCMWTSKQDLIEMMPPQLNLYVVRSDQNNKEVKRWPVEGASIGSSVHSITQSKNWLIFAESGNFKVDFNEMMGMERDTIHDFESKIWLVNKQELDATPAGHAIRPIEVVLKPSIGHCYADDHDEEGIRLLCEHLDITDLTFSLREGDLNAHGDPVHSSHYRLYNHSMARSTISEVIINPTSGEIVNKVARQYPWSWNQQLSAMDYSLEGRRAPKSHHMIYQGFRPQFITQRAVDQYKEYLPEPLTNQAETPARLVTYQRGTLDILSSYEFPSLDQIPSSPTFVPRTNEAGEIISEPGGHNGYVVVPVLSDQGVSIQLFDASQVGQGPIAILKGSHQEQVPVLLHTLWMPKVIPPEEYQGEYQRLTLEEDLQDDPVFASLPDDLKQCVLGISNTASDNNSSN